MIIGTAISKAILHCLWMLHLMVLCCTSHSTISHCWLLCYLIRAIKSISTIPRQIIFSRRRLLVESLIMPISSVLLLEVLRIIPRSISLKIILLLTLSFKSFGSSWIKGSSKTSFCCYFWLWNMKFRGKKTTRQLRINLRMQSILSTSLCVVTHVELMVFL